MRCNCVLYLLSHISDYLLPSLLSCGEMEKNIKIGFVGGMCTGKDTLAQLFKKINPNFTTYAIATPIKEIAARYFGVVKKDRLLLQNIGRALRAINRDIWIDWTMNKIKVEKCHAVIVTDIRSEREATKLCNAGFELIWLDIPISIRIKRIMTVYPNSAHTHISGLEDQTEKLAHLKKYCKKIYSETTMLSAYKWVYKYLKKI